jgi:hypothetical protein
MNPVRGILDRHGCDQYHSRQRCGYIVTVAKWSEMDRESSVGD